MQGRRRAGHAARRRARHPEGESGDIGGEAAGEHAAANAVGMGADVTIIDLNILRLRELEVQFQGKIQTRAPSAYEIAAQLAEADLVVGSVLVRCCRLKLSPTRWWQA